MKISSYLFIVVALFLMTFDAQSSSISLPHDGIIRFYLYHVDEAAEFKYLDENGKWIPDVYEKMNQMMRSRGDDKEITMDKRLIELADHLQDHFKVDTIEIISGYRSRAFNKSLKDAGRNVANESLHTKGMAMDVHIDEIKESTLRDYLRSLKLGGVGYYGNVLMVHMDFGTVRYWHSGDYFDNTTIGIFNKASPIEIKTDKLFYSAGSKMVLKYTGISKESMLTLQKFHRQKWIDVVSKKIKDSDPVPLKDMLDRIAGMSVYGKFRFHYKGNSDWQNSNEFYVKKM